MHILDIKKWILRIHFVCSEADDWVDKESGGDVINFDQLCVIKAVLVTKHLTEKPNKIILQTLC